MQRRRVHWFDSLRQGSSLRLVWRICAIAVVGMAATTALFYLFYDRLLATLAQSLSLQLLPDELVLVSNSLPSLHGAMAGWLVALVLCQTVITLTGVIWLTSRMAGPIYAIRRALERLAAGDLAAEVVLRQGDDMHELAESINDCSARIQVMVMGLKENLLALEQLHSQQQDTELELRLQVIKQNLDWFETVVTDDENQLV